MKRLVVLQHISREGPGLFSKIAKELGMRILIIRLYLDEDLPKLLEGDVLLILGGPMGIMDIEGGSYKWLSKEVEFIKAALQQKICMIGVCLGAQLIAYAAGGGVEHLVDASSREPCPEVGWDLITVEGDHVSDLAPILQNPLNVLHWHGDRILLPSSAKLIARSRRCKEQFFNIGRFAYGMQFHIEIDDKMVINWIEEDQAFVKAALGEDAPRILMAQQKRYGKVTLERRLDLLRMIFDSFKVDI